MTEATIKATLPHLVSVEVIGNPVFLFRVTTEAGYYIKMPLYEELAYKTVGIVYPDYDLSTIQIVAEADLPEDAVMDGETLNQQENTETI